MNGAFIWYKNFSSKLFIFVKVHAFDGQTDGRMDRLRPQSYRHAKNVLIGCDIITRMQQEHFTQLQ